MTDIAPELLEKVQQSFEAETAGLRDEIANGVKSYEEAYAYAIQVGEALSKSFGVNITPEVLPDGMMYYNIADKVVRPMLQAEYELTSAAAVQAQGSANRAAGIGIKPLTADFDENRAQGIIDRVSSQPFEEVSWLLNEPVKSFSKNVVDQTLEKNVEFQGKSGLSPKIRRTANGETCEWCQAVAGTYEYPNVPKDVYRRHANCDCVVEYLDGGKIQDVHTKAIYKSQAERDAAVQERIARAQEQKAKEDERKRLFGRNTHFKTGDEDSKEYMESKDPLRGFKPVTPQSAVPLARMQAREWISNLEESAKKLIQTYTYNQDDTKPKFYERINSFIRNGYRGDKDYTKQVEIISSALKDSKLLNDYKCYRGSDYNPFAGMKPGESKKVDQFFSTTIAPSKSFEGEYSIIVYAQKGTNAAYIEELSAYPSQREMLFDKDVEYEVLYQQGNTVVVRTKP